MTCDRFRVGYEGQRFQVICKDENENDFSVGWTNLEDGGGLVKMVNLHPVWHSPRVVEVKKP